MSTSVSAPMEAFKFGSLSLPTDVEERAKNLCASLNLTSTELFYKWEAWALNHQHVSDIPTQADLDQLATSIRDKAEKAEAVLSAARMTPRSASKQRSTSVLHRAVEVPISVNIDDFFNYVPEIGNTDNVKPSPRRKLELGEENVEGVEVKQEMEWTNENANKNSKNINNKQGDDDEITIKEDQSTPRKVRVGVDAGERDVEMDDTGRGIEKYREEGDINLPMDGTMDKGYASRAGSGRVEATHSRKVETLLSSSAASQASGTTGMKSQTSRVSKGVVKCHVIQSLPEDTRYMNDDIATRVRSMRDRVKTIGGSILKRIADSRGLETPPECLPHAFYVASPDVTWALGRIRVDLDEADGVGAGRINAQSVQLESIDGALVKLDLSRLKTDERPVFLSPGAVVVVEGVNVNGRSIDVHTIHDNSVHHVSILPLEQQQSGNEAAGDAMMDDVDINNEEGNNKESVDQDEPDTQEQEHIKNSNIKEPVKLIKIITAAGPFTTMSNLQYEPLNDFLDVVGREAPDVAVVVGPFVDGRHTLVNEQLPATFDSVFEQRVLRKVMKASAKLGASCKFLIVPSLDDIHHDFVAPQPAFQWPGSLQGEGIGLNITFVSNPSIVEVSDPTENAVARLAITSLPAVVDVSADCICWNVDRFHALAAHLIRQQSMYPVVPPSQNVPLDSTLLHALHIPSSPDAPSVDLLLCPSKVKGFVRCVDEGVVVVNPGLLCKGHGGGTYAEVSLPLHRRDTQRSRAFNEENSEVNVIRL